jgi:hypothetical protein
VCAIVLKSFPFSCIFQCNSQSGKRKGGKKVSLFSIDIAFMPTGVLFFSFCFFVLILLWGAY